MTMVSLQTTAERDAEHASATAGEKKDPLAGMTVLTADEQAPGHKGIQVTLKALKRIRNAMARENVSPEMGGLRVGITGGGCSGLSYNIRFDSQPRERDRVYSFSQGPLGVGADAPNIRIFVDPKSFIYLHGMVLRLRRDNHEAGVQLHQSQLDEELRMWVELFFLIGIRLL